MTSRKAIFLIFAALWALTSFVLVLGFDVDLKFELIKTVYYAFGLGWGLFFHWLLNKSGQS